MFSVDGYEPVTELWRYFEDKFGQWCHDRAEECYRSESFAQADIFGSPRDLSEDLFLKTLENTRVSFTRSDGTILNVEPVLSGTNARLFEKATVFESFTISQRAEEAGANNEWLFRMGSACFSPSAHADLNVKVWLRSYGRDIAEFPPDSDQTDKVFHTLPYFFERSSFVVPKELPPWASDIIEDAYLRNLIADTGCAAICVSSSKAAGWKRKVNVSKLFDLLQKRVSSVSFDKSESESPHAGRPRKVDLVAELYAQLTPKERALSWKEKCELVNDRGHLNFSVTTLKRAAKMVDGDTQSDRQ